MKQIIFLLLSFYVIIFSSQCKKEDDNDKKDIDTIPMVRDIYDSIYVTIDSQSIASKGYFNGFGESWYEIHKQFLFTRRTFNFNLFIDLHTSSILSVTFINEWTLPDSMQNITQSLNYNPTEKNGGLYTSGDKNYFLYEKEAASKFDFYDTALVNKLNSIIPNGIMIEIYDEKNGLWTTKYFHFIIKESEKEAFIKNNYAFKVTKRETIGNYMMVYADFKAVLFNQQREQKKIEKGSLIITIGT